MSTPCLFVGGSALGRQARAKVVAGQARSATGADGVVKPAVANNELLQYVGAVHYVCTSMH